MRACERLHIYCVRVCDVHNRRVTCINGLNRSGDFPRENKNFTSQRIRCAEIALGAIPAAVASIRSGNWLRVIARVQFLKLLSSTYAVITRRVRGRRLSPVKIVI